MIHTAISMYMPVKAVEITCIKCYLSLSNLYSFVNMSRRLRLRVIFLASLFLCLSHLTVLHISCSPVDRF